MSDGKLEKYFEEIRKRELVDGGFLDVSKGSYRTDATAWGIILLGQQRSNALIVDRARDRLFKDQHPDGRITISPIHYEAYWPTPLAIMAWHGSDPYHSGKDRAINFLLNVSGLHWGKTSEDPIGHDPSIHGWPWIENTHSWVAPTALTLIALSFSGYRNHHRVATGARMLLNRQLPGGGWNYGNTTVFDKTLQPFPETTGMALTALAGHVSPESIGDSLDYLAQEVPTLRTPVSLGWAILGLKAWGRGTPGMDDGVLETLGRAGWYGGYPTTSLAVLLAAAATPVGLEGLIEDHGVVIPGSAVHNH